mgnify:CR=1 FL=1
MSDNGTEKRATMTMVANGGFALASGDATIAAGGAVTLAAAQTNVNSILATDLKLGEDAQTKIDFETANEIHFDVNNAELLNLTGAKISGSGISTGSFGNLIASAIELPDDSIPIAQLASDAVTVTAGTGLTGGGSVTLGGSTTVNVIGGDGITANANDMAITAAQTTIESILKADLVIGEDAQTKIDFGTANIIKFFANNAEKMTISDTGVVINGDITAEQYIVKSTVTQITQSFSSGSTIFGDTTDDKHRFTGSIEITSSLLTIDSVGDDYPNKLSNPNIIKAIDNAHHLGFQCTIFSSRNMRTFKGDLEKIEAHTRPIAEDWLHHC